MYTHFIYVFFFIYSFSQTVLALWGLGAFNAGGSDAIIPRLGIHENNEFRTGIMTLFTPLFIPTGS